MSPANRPDEPRVQLRVRVDHRRVLALALPMTLSHVTTPLLGFVGAAVIGRLGDAALIGAMALGAVIFDFLFWTFGALRMTTAGLTAQATGAGDLLEIDRTLARALLAAALVGAVIIVLQWPLGVGAFALSGGSPAVLGPLATYFGIRIYAAPFTLANYAILGSTLGRGRTDLGLILQLAINLINVVLTIVLVIGLHFGIAGAALATVAAEAAGIALGALVLGRLGSRPWRVPAAEVLQRAALIRMLAVNRDVMIRTAALLVVFACFSAIGARAGDVTLAANAVLENMFMIGGYFLDGFATAAETLCGQSIGARDEAAFRKTVGLSLGWCLGFGAVVSALFLAIGTSFIDAITTNAEVRALARQFLPYAAVSPLVGAAAFAFDGIYVGATWTGAMRNLMLAALALYLVALLTLHSAGNAGLWLALLIFLGARGVGQALLYPRRARTTFRALSAPVG